MNEPVTPTIDLHEILYGTERVEDDFELEKNIEQLDSKRRAGEQPGQYSRPSVYVEAFEQMVNTVLQSESHLLTEKEINVLDAFSRLCYNARYCLVRLMLRKTNSWQTLASMEGFKKEVGEEGLRHAMDTLCEPVVGSKSGTDFPNPKGSRPEHEVIDLTGDSDEECTPQASETEAMPLKTSNQDIHFSLDDMLNSRDEPGCDLDFNFFLEDDSHMSLNEALHKLNNDQLKDLVKQTRVKPNQMNKPGMVHALSLYASTQSPLKFISIPKGKAGIQASKKRRRSAIITQEHRLFQMALEKLGKSVRVNANLYWLFTQLNVVYDRCTEYPKSLLVPSLLTSFKKRAYPGYNYKRDGTIWPTRDIFLEYFEALKLEAAIDDELDESTTNSKTAASTSALFTTPKASKKVIYQRSSTSLISNVDMDSRCDPSRNIPPTCNEEEEEVPAKIRIATKVKKVFDELVLPKWKALIARKKIEEARTRTPGLDRFEPGFVYTRIFSKGMRALATLKLFKEEAQALNALLDQRFWRCGKRAKWYERRAILQTRYLCFTEDAEKKRDPDVLRQAMEGVRQALMDADTGLVFRPGLVRRLRRLEKQLKVPEDQQCDCAGELRTANVVEFSAERLYTTSKSTDANSNGSAGSGLRTYFPIVKTPVKGGTTSGKENRPVSVSPSNDWKWKGKSIWKGVNGEELTVEDRALQYYESLGFKGFHSESRVLTTIYSLLFWDIIFTDIPGAFETPYQSAPLDLAEDSFFRARKDLMKARLEEIKSDEQAVATLGRHDELYREKKTWCVGVRWDICERQDLLEIVKCLGGGSLSVICQLFCEDYAGRSSGVPDLVVWDIDRGLCKFVEVKGPGDRPQENQKLWFDSLLSAGANVEICKVLDKNQPAINKSSVKRKGTRRSSTTNTKGKGRASTVQSDNMDDSDPDYHDHGASKSPVVLRDRLSVLPDKTHVRLHTLYASHTLPMLSSIAPQTRPADDDIIPPRLKRHKIIPHGSPP